MKSLPDLGKAIAVVKPSADAVLFENVNRKGLCGGEGMIDQSAPKSLPVTLGMNKEAPDLIADHGNETNRPPIDTDNVGHGVRQVQISQISGLSFDKIRLQKRVCQCGRGTPDFDQRFSIFSSVFTDHCFTFHGITGCRVVRART